MKGLQRCCSIILTCFISEVICFVLAPTHDFDFKLPPTFFPPVAFRRPLNMTGCPDNSEISIDRIRTIGIYIQDAIDKLNLIYNKWLNEFQRRDNQYFKISELNPQNLHNISLYLNTSSNQGLSGVRLTSMDNKTCDVLKIEEYLHKSYARVIIWSAYLSPLRRLPAFLRIQSIDVDDLLHDTSKIAVAFDTFAEAARLLPFQEDVLHYRYSVVGADESSAMVIIQSVLKNGQNTLRNIKDVITTRLPMELSNCEFRC